MNNNNIELKKESEYHIICNICNEDLGVERLYWGKEHLKKYPNHRSYRQIRLDKK